MADDTPKWDCSLVGSKRDGLILLDYDDKTIDNPKDYIGKTLQLTPGADTESNSYYWQQYDIQNYYNETWGYIDNYLFETIPNSEYEYEYTSEYLLGKLIAILDKKK